MELKRQYKKERLQNFANNYIRKNTMGILLGLLIALATVGCPASNTGGPQTGTFPYVCPDGTPTAGMFATEDTVSCSACNTGFNLTDTKCMAGPQTGTFPYICPNGTPTAGMIATEDTVSCSACNTGFDLTGTRCMAGPDTGTFPYVCPNGTPTAGMIATQDTISCSSCDTGFNPVGTRCINGCTGTAIATPAELMNIATTGDFHLTSDIDLTGVTWTPKAFNGCLNGQGFVISNLSLSPPLMNNGLFSALEESAIIENLGLEDVNITGMLPGSAVTGSIAATNAGTIRASYAHGQITARTGDSAETTGGLVGINTGTIQESYAHVSIGSDSLASGVSVGGIVGFNSGGTIENSFATGGASSLVRGQGQVGGLVGLHQIVSTSGSRAASIANSYSVAIRARGVARSGGLVGLGEGYSPLSLGASIANSYTATQPLGARLLGGLVGDANSLRITDTNIGATTFLGKNYYTTINNGITGVGDGSCAAANCIQATGTTNGQRRTWLADTLNETDLGWSADIWNNLGVTGWPCLKKISNIFSGKDGCPPMAPFICPGGTATVGNSVTGSISCSACTTTEGYKMVGSECVRFEGDFSRIGTANEFSASEDNPRGLASIEDTLYMVGVDNDALYTLDTSSGIATQVGAVGNIAAKGLASITITENGTTTTTLYMVSDGLNALYTLDITAGSSTRNVATRVGTSNNFNVNEISPDGLASIGDTLYMVGAQTRALYTLDITSSGSTLGQATRVGAAVNFGVSFDKDEDRLEPRGLASIGDTLYMLDSKNNSLYTLDITVGSSTLGQATRVGATSDFGVREGAPEGLASIGDTLYMVSDDNDALYKSVVE